MKQLYIQAPTQHPKSIEDAFSVKNQSNIGRNSRRLAILNPNQAGGAFGTDKCEWQGTGLCKGPPGRPRSPGMFPEHPPDGGATPYRVPNLVGANTPRNTGIQIFKNNKFNYYSQSNFTIMKKQILILAIFVLALFVGIKSVDAQNLTAAPTCPIPNALSCAATTGGLNPIPYFPYDYEVSVPTPAGGTFTYDWFVTTDKDFIKTSTLQNTMETPIPSAHVLAVGSGATLSAYHDPANGKAKINITWKSFIADPANPVFLVIYVKNTVTCQTDNIQVYEIKPQPAFTLDVANLKVDGTDGGANYASCVSPIVAAKWTAAGSPIDMDYGENYVYFAVTAANFNHSWKPAFKVSASEKGTATMDVSWAYKADATANTNWHTTTFSGTDDYASTDVVNSQSPLNGFIGSGGECIVVRVHVDNNNENTQTNNTISFAVDGIMYDPATTAYATAALGDVHYTGGTCGQTDGFTNDVATQIISARPDIQATSPTPFINKNK